MYLPIGSVVLLKNMPTRTMIFGRTQKDAVSGKTYDYVGCGYPEGFLSADKTVLFNDQDIQIVFCLGYQSVEEFKLRSELIERRGDNND